jgi:hypothetical protein
MDRLPAGEEDEEGGDPAHEEGDRRDHRVGLDQAIRGAMDLEAGRGAGPEAVGRWGTGFHRPRPGKGVHRSPPVRGVTFSWASIPPVAAAVAGAGMTSIRPTIT